MRAYMEANDSGEARRLGLTDWEDKELPTRPGTGKGGSPNCKSTRKSNRHSTAGWTEEQMRAYMEANDSEEARRLGLTDWEGAELPSRPGTRKGGSPKRKTSATSGECVFSECPAYWHASENWLIFLNRQTK